MDIKICDKFSKVIANITNKSDEFSSVQNKLAVELRNATKLVYDFTKEESQRNTNTLPELVTEDFDEEQIWQQIRLQDDINFHHLSSCIPKLLSKPLVIPISTVNPQPLQSNENLSDNETINESFSDCGEELKNSPERKREPTRKRKRSSIVDDKFFKLEELDEYLTREEKKQNQHKKENDDDDDDDDDEEDSDNESVDFFNDFSDDDASEETKYADFFDSPQSEDENFNDSRLRKDTNNEESDDQESLNNNSDFEDEMDVDMESENQKSSKKKVTFNLTNDSDETDSLENKSISVKDDTEIKSSLEIRQERLNKKIGKLEEEAVSEKPWQLKGEISAANRPQNSILEENLEVDIVSRPPLVITEQVTLTLEDILEQRVRDNAFDDVEKKFKPVETPSEYKKQLILDQEKSKESLSQIYENEYLKQKQTLNPDNEKEEEEPKLHIEIREMMHSVFSKLDALSNFHYTPKQVKPEIKIVSNISAINMEEVAPVGMSDANLLAPEEIKTKSRGELISKAERTKTDMKRERRHKKIRQHEKQQAIEKKKKLNALKPGIAKKLLKNRNVTRMVETDYKALKSSTTFFNQLQDEVNKPYKIDASKKKKQKNVLSAVQFKL